MRTASCSGGRIARPSGRLPRAGGEREPPNGRRLPGPVRVRDAEFRSSSMDTGHDLDGACKVPGVDEEVGAADEPPVHRDFGVDRADLRSMRPPICETGDRHGQR